MAFNRTIYNNFKTLINNFINQEIDVNAFEKDYLDLWRKYRDTDDARIINKEFNDALDRMFTSVESYCADESLRDEYDIDEPQLYRSAKEILGDLENGLNDDCHE